MSKSIIILMGPPGAGKGSLSQLCVKNLGWVQLSTGFLCRKHIAEQTPLGKEIDFCIKSGNLISDNLIVAMVEEWLKEHGSRYNSVILDGFPRTVAQAEALDALIKTKFLDYRVSIVCLTLSDTAVLERILYRFVCKNKDCQAVYSNAQNSIQQPKIKDSCDFCSSELARRADDEEATIHERLKVFYTYAHKLLDFYRLQGQLINNLDVNKPLDTVFQEFKMIMKLV